MRKTAAFILAGVGLVLAVGVPIVIAVAFNIDPGRRPGVLVGGMMPGIGVMVFAHRLWKAGEAPKPPPGPIPPGYQVCDLCGNVLPETEGVARHLDPRMPTTRMAFVCYACARYRNKRALIVLALFLAALGLFALVVQLTIPGAKK
jgi:hypothetical protein